MPIVIAKSLVPDFELDAKQEWHFERDELVGGSFSNCKTKNSLTDSFPSIDPWNLRISVSNGCLPPSHKSRLAFEESSRPFDTLRKKSLRSSSADNSRVIWRISGIANPHHFSGLPKLILILAMVTSLASAIHLSTSRPLSAMTFSRSKRLYQHTAHS